MGAAVVTGVLVLAAVVATGVPSFAHAQRPSAEAGDARALFEEGAQAYRDERYPDALRAFEASYRAREVPVVLFNVAQTLRALDRPAEAIEAYRRYLRTDSDLDAARREAIESVIAELAPQVCFVRVELVPEDAELEVDGRSLGRGPFAEPIAVDPGSRRFEARAPGYVSATRSLQLRPGTERALPLALREEPPSGTLRLSVNVDEARVAIDDAPHGTVGREARELRLTLGRHALRVEADGYADHTSTFELSRDGLEERAVVLERRESLAEKWWLWAAIGGAVLVGVVVALAVALPARTDPLEGTLPTVGALRLEVR